MSASPSPETVERIRARVMALIDDWRCQRSGCAEHDAPPATTPRPQPTLPNPNVDIRTGRPVVRRKAEA
jgi:hypothetical protein